MPNLSHIDEQGRARMVDVSAKPETARTAVASGRVLMDPGTARLIRDGALKKGDVLATARLAGIMAAKRTADLIPLCHPLPLTDVEVVLRVETDHVEITATARTVGRTGVEMEALAAVSVAALTIYDMAKAVDRGMTIEGIRLESKTGGTHGDWQRDGDESTEDAPESGPGARGEGRDEAF